MGNRPKQQWHKKSVNKQMKQEEEAKNNLKYNGHHLERTSEECHSLQYNGVWISFLGNLKNYHKLCCSKHFRSWKPKKRLLWFIPQDEYLNG